MTKLLGRGLVKCCLKTTTQSIRCRGWWVPILNLIIVLLFFAQVLICDVLTLADAGLIPEEVERKKTFQFLKPTSSVQVKWRILAYGINEEEFGPNMAFFLCSHASLRFHSAQCPTCCTSTLDHYNFSRVGSQGLLVSLLSLILQDTIVSF